MVGTTRLLATALCALLAACNGGNEEVAANTAAIDDIDVLPADESATTATGDLASGVAEPVGGDATAALAIPAEYRGRWGMVAADCEPGRSDAKGLITIGDTSIRFYESTATLQAARPGTAGFAGNYGFTGEGQSWEREVTLTRSGDTLVRADDEGRYTYRRCA